jgi:hypothetical protein
VPGPHTVTSVKLNPDLAFPDVQVSNNNWPRAPQP